MIEKAGLARSVPDVTACTVAVTNTTNESWWIPCHTRRGIQRIAHDVTWTTTIP